MAATNPILELILLNVVSVVDGITTGAGYNQTLNAVRQTRDDLESATPPTNGVVIIECDDPEPGTLLAGSPARQEWTVLIACIAFVIPSDAETTAFDTLMNRVRADIEKALQADHTRGGYAINTLPAGSVKFVIPGGPSGVQVTSRVTYRTRLTDPYTQA